MSDHTTIDTLPDPDKKHCEQFCRQLGATIAVAMATANLSFDEIGVKINTEGSVIRSVFLCLMDGESVRMSSIVRILDVCGFKLDITLEKIG